MFKKKNDEQKILRQRKHDNEEKGRKMRNENVQQQLYIATKLK